LMQMGIPAVYITDPGESIHWGPQRAE
jgi:hypothetical protein